MRFARRLVPPVMAASLICASVQLPSVAWAAPPAEDSLEEAEKLWKDGKVKFETADYTEALDLWKQAYALLPEGEDAQVVKHALVYNISEAELKSYEINRDAMHLRKAKVLLEQYLKEHRALYGDEADAVKEREDVTQRLAEIETKIGEAEEREAAAAAAAGGEQKDESKPEPKNEGPKTPRQLREQEIKEDPALYAEYSKATRGVVGGSVMLGFGFIFGITGAIAWSVYGRAVNCVPDPDDIISFGCPNEGAWLGTSIAFTVAGVGLLGGGGAMMGLGIKKRKKMLSVPVSSGPGADEAPKEAPKPTAGIAPWANPQGGGVTFSLRF